MNTNFIDRVPYIFINIGKLIIEYDTFIVDKMTDVTNHGNAVLVQKKFHLINDNKQDELINNLPYTKSIIESASKILDFSSVTYRIIMPNTCYNWHCDEGKLCLHIPLITNIGCFFVYENRNYRMPADGSLYLVNNEKMHTFINSGNEPRLHLTLENL